MIDLNVWIKFCVCQLVAKMRNSSYRNKLFLNNPFKALTIHYKLLRWSSVTVNVKFYCCYKLGEIHKIVFNEIVSDRLVKYMPHICIFYHFLRLFASESRQLKNMVNTLIILLIAWNFRNTRIAFISKKKYLLYYKKYYSSIMN